jgi:hypothetical protein
MIAHGAPQRLGDGFSSPPVVWADGREASASWLVGFVQKICALFAPHGFPQPHSAKVCPGVSDSLLPGNLSHPVYTVVHTTSETRAVRGSGQYVPSSAPTDTRFRSGAAAERVCEHCPAPGRWSEPMTSPCELEAPRCAARGHHEHLALDRHLRLFRIRTNPPHTQQRPYIPLKGHTLWIVVRGNIHYSAET